MEVSQRLGAPQNPDVDLLLSFLPGSPLRAPFRECLFPWPV
jgi:hypothetical protein